MNSRKYVIQETLRVAIGVAVCVAAMIGIFALLGQFSREVVLGGIVAAWWLWVTSSLWPWV